MMAVNNDKKNKVAFGFRPLVRNPLTSAFLGLMAAVCPVVETVAAESDGPARSAPHNPRKYISQVSVMSV